MQMCQVVPSQSDFAPSWVWNVTPSKKALLKTVIKCICPQGSCYSRLCPGTSAWSKVSRDPWEHPEELVGRFSGWCQAADKGGSAWAAPAVGTNWDCGQGGAGAAQEGWGSLSDGAMPSHMLLLRWQVGKLWKRCRNWCGKQESAELAADETGRKKHETFFFPVL